MHRGDSPADRIPGSPRPSIPIWLGLIGPPSAALTHITLGYPVEHTSCATQTLFQFHVLTAVLLAVTAGAGWIARREWHKHGSTVPGEGPPPHGPRRLMALLGMVGAVAFGFIIIVQWLPVTMLPPCIRT
jgi:hypothetical protein